MKGGVMGTIRDEDDPIPNQPAGMTGSVVAQIIALVADIVGNWEVDLATPIGVDTLLVADLGCGSIDIIHLVVSIEEHFNHPRMGFQVASVHSIDEEDDMTRLSHYDKNQEYPPH